MFIDTVGKSDEKTNDSLIRALSKLVEPSRFFSRGQEHILRRLYFKISHFFNMTLGNSILVTYDVSLNILAREDLAYFSLRDSFELNNVFQKAFVGA